VIAGLARAGSLPESGRDLPHLFASAGLSRDGYFIEVIPVVDADETSTAQLAGVVRSLAPALERFGIATAEEVGVDTLLTRLLAEAQREPGVVFGPMVAGIWGRRA